MWSSLDPPTISLATASSSSWTWTGPLEYVSITESGLQEPLSFDSDGEWGRRAFVSVYVSVHADVDVNAIGESASSPPSASVAAVYTVQPVTKVKYSRRGRKLNVLCEWKNRCVNLVIDIFLKRRDTVAYRKAFLLGGRQAIQHRLSELIWRCAEEIGLNWEDQRDDDLYILTLFLLSVFAPLRMRCKHVSMRSRPADHMRAVEFVF